MKPTCRSLFSSALVAASLALAAGAAFADEAAIRKNIPERLPNFPKLDEVVKTAIPGLYEIRFGNEIRYTDENGSFLIEGDLIDLKTKTNLTEARTQKLMATAFKSLPVKDALVWKQGTGERKLYVFADPNCGYCKKFERDLVAVKDVTVYTFLIPILGGDSAEKAAKIWCSKDNTKVWRDWMTQGKPIGEPQPCDIGAIQRNAAFARAHKINGTPGLIFEDGKHIPGAIGPEAIEKRLDEARAKG